MSDPNSVREFTYEFLSPREIKNTKTESEKVSVDIIAANYAVFRTMFPMGPMRGTKPDQYSVHTGQCLRNDLMQNISDEDKKEFIKWVKKFNGPTDYYMKYYIGQKFEDLPKEIKPFIIGYLLDISVYKEAYNNGDKTLVYSPIPHMISKEEYESIN